ncbi:MAG: phosphotransferase [Acidimicrobiia bacterium]
MTGRPGVPEKRRDRVELAVDEVAGAWDLGRWEDWHRTPKGSTNTSWFVTTDRGRFVVRISNPSKTEDGMAREVALLEHLRARRFPAPVVVPSRAGDGWGRVGGALCLVTERLPGSFPDLGDPGHLAESARALARFHQEGRHLPEPARPTLGSELGLLGEGPALLARADELIAGLVGPEGRGRWSRARSALEPAFAEVGALRSGNGALPHMVTHGSLGVSAVLFEGPRLTGILDYERAAHELRALDLAYALRALTRRPKEEPGAFDLPRFGVFLAAYQQVEALAPGEAERLPQVLRAQRLLKVAGKTANLVAKHATVPQQEKDAFKLIETLELELPRLRWLEEHEGELMAAADPGQAR